MTRDWGGEEHQESAVEEGEVWPRRFPHLVRKLLGVGLLTRTAVETEPTPREVVLC